MVQAVGGRAGGREWQLCIPLPSAVNREILIEPSLDVATGSLRTRSTSDLQEP